MSLELSEIPDEQYPDTPLRDVLQINEHTGLPDGNDGENLAINHRTGRAYSPGYRRIPTSEDDFEPLIRLDGVQVNHAERKDFGFPGTAELVARESVVRGLAQIATRIRHMWGGERDLLAVSAYRPLEAQVGWFKWSFADVQRTGGVDPDKLTDAQILHYGRQADLTSAWVYFDGACPNAQTLLAELHRDQAFMGELREAATGDRQGAASAEASVLDEKALRDYVTISANIGRGRAAGRNVRLDVEGNAHAGGGAIDSYVVKKGHGGAWHKIGPTNFYECSPWASVRCFEDEGNWDSYRSAVKVTPTIQAHLRENGIDPDNITDKDIQEMRGVMRLLTYLALSMRGSFYDPGVVGGAPAQWNPTEAGEYWHINLPQTVVAKDGTVIHPTYDARFRPFAGNTCLTLVNVPDGSDRIAPYGAATARTYAEKHLGGIQ